jgi:hypothetical protein
MKKCFSFLLLYALLSSNIFAQANLQNKEDSILKIINTSNNVSTICDGYLKIAKFYTAQNIAKETEYINKTIFKIEQSRDRKLIAIYYRKVADQWNAFPTPERQSLALIAIDKGLQIAKEAQLNKEAAILLVRKAITYRAKGDISEALKYNEESTSYAALSKSDSVVILSELSHANTLIEKDENLAAFKKYMHALNLAEIVKDEKYQTVIDKLIADFYVKVGQTEKAKDYYMKGLELSKKLKDSTVELSIYQSMITLYSDTKDFASAREYLKILKKKEKESSFYKQYALSAESSIIAQEDIKKLPEFVRQNKDLMFEYEKYGMQSQMYRLKGIIFTIDKKYDSALYNLMRSRQSLNPNNLSDVLNWNNWYAYYLEQNKKYMEAAKYIDENVLVAKKMQSLTFEKTCYEYLDSMYVKAGNKEKEVTNKLLLFSIKDSLNKQQKANDLLGVEIDIENKRNERAAAENQLKLDKRNNLQYMGISGAIIFLFIALAAMGKFKVKPWFIRALGFLSFILLFEFIILLIDHQIHDLTHGEPLPLLLIKIVIIAFLLPLHHWLEHTVITYLMRTKSMMNKPSLV